MAYTSGCQFPSGTSRVSVHGGDRLCESAGYTLFLCELYCPLYCVRSGAALAGASSTLRPPKAPPSLTATYPLPSARAVTRVLLLADACGDTMGAATYMWGADETQEVYMLRIISLHARMHAREIVGPGYYRPDN